MKSLFISVCLLLATPAFAGAMSGYICEAPGLKVTISGDSSEMTVVTETTASTYKVTRITSMTGDTDQTLETAEGISVTIDDQYGDFLTEATGQTTSLNCRN